MLLIITKLTRPIIMLITVALFVTAACKKPTSTTATITHPEVIIYNGTDTNIYFSIYTNFADSGNGANPICSGMLTKFQTQAVKNDKFLLYHSYYIQYYDSSLQISNYWGVTNEDFITMRDSQTLYQIKPLFNPYREVFYNSSKPIKWKAVNAFDSTTFNSIWSTIGDSLKYKELTTDLSATVLYRHIIAGDTVVGFLYPNSCSFDIHNLTAEGYYYPIRGIDSTNGFVIYDTYQIGPSNYLSISPSIDTLLVYLQLQGYYQFVRE